MNPTSQPQREIARIVEAPGIVAAHGQDGTEDVLLFASTGLPTTDDERSSWKTLFEAGWLALAKARAQDPGTVEIRILLNNHTMILHQEETIRVGVAFSKGAPVVKSLPRMIRKAFRRLGCPTAPPAPRNRSSNEGSSVYFHRSLEKTQSSF